MDTNKKLENKAFIEHAMQGIPSKAFSAGVHSPEGGGNKTHGL